MKLSCDAKSLSTAAHALSPFFSSPGLVSGNSLIHLEATPDRLQCSGHSREMSGSLSIEATVELPGTAAMDGRAFMRYLREAPDGQLALTLEDHVAIFTNGPSLLRLKTIDPDAPASGDPTGPPLYTISADELTALLTRTTFAASHSNVGQPTEGILLELLGSTLTVVATNGHHLACATYTIQAPPPTNGHHEIPLAFILPRRSATALRQLLTRIDPATPLALVLLDTGRLSLAGGPIRFETLPLNATYPNWRGILPTDFGPTCTVNLDAFRQAIRLASAGLTDRMLSVVCTLTRDQLTLSSHGDSDGSNVTHMSATWTGDDLTLRFNPHYLLEALTIMDGPNLTLDLRGPLAPIFGQSDGMPGFRYVLMPMAL